jgi:GDP-4-dehydro-6-deoxy-D-mannose reductase
VILVTGAGGFAGSHLLDHLIGSAPIVAWRRPGRPAPVNGPGLVWQEMDVRDKAAVARALGDVRPTAIYHVAGAARVDTAWANVVPHLETNVLGTHYLLEGVRTNGLSCRVLVVSSALVYDMATQPIDEETPLEPASPYGRSKLAQDLLALRASGDDGLDVVVARPFNHIGPRQEPNFAIPSFARQIALIEAGLADPVIRVGNLDARRDLLDVRDVVDAYERLMRGGVTGRAYNICSGKAVRIGDALEQLQSLSRTPFTIAVEPDRLRPSDTPVIVGSAKRLTQELGWTPRFELLDTLRDTLDWWRQQLTH